MANANPSKNWPAIDARHTQMGTFKQGVILVRHQQWASLAVDYLGLC